MFILLLNQDWFAEEFRARGHKVVTVGLNESLDINLPLPLMHIDRIVAQYLDGEWPDRVIIHDNSAPVCVVGLEEREVPTLFYSVDAHHHSELHGELAKVFDHTLVAQKDYIKEMEEISGTSMEWMPLWASRYVEAEEEKEYGAVFVGSLKRNLNPERVDFFEALEKEVPILYKSGAWWGIFPKSEIVINQTVKKDLNFRVFEAMICGALLLTEKTENGLFDLFEDEKHLITYTKGNVSEAAEKIKYYLAHKDEARKIAMAGREEILRHHLIEHRARHVEELCLKLQHNPNKPKRHFGWMANCNGLATRLRTIDTELSKQAIVHAVKSADAAIKAGEVLDSDGAFVLVYACCYFDRYHQSDSGRQLLEVAYQRFPEQPLIGVAVVRGLLNQGRVEEARKIAQKVSDEKPEDLFRKSEEIITALLEVEHEGIGSQIKPALV